MPYEVLNRMQQNWSRSAVVTGEACVKAATALVDQARACATEGAETGTALAQDILKARDAASALELQRKYFNRFVDGAVSRSRSLTSVWMEFGDAFAKAAPGASTAAGDRVGTDQPAARKAA